jgi:tryptophan synthase alpha chain
MKRYADMFSNAQSQHQGQGQGRGVFVPFFMLGDPDLETSLALMNAAVAAGADALELGIPFSDPVADGPVVQAASERALAAGAKPSVAFELVRRFREAHPHTPIGLLVYANLVFGPGIDGFYKRAAAAGVDSVLIADVPVAEGAPFVASAVAHKIAPVFIAPSDASPATLRAIAKHSAGYTYCLARSGVTGTDETLSLSHDKLFATLKELGAPPPLLGFGISKPEHVRAAVAAGAAGAICGSAIAQRIAAHRGDRNVLLREVSAFLREMRSACDA